MSSSSGWRILGRVQLELRGFEPMAIAWLPPSFSWRPEMAAALSVKVNRSKPAAFNRRKAPGTSGYGGIVANRSVSSSRSVAVILTPLGVAICSRTAPRRCR
jgi:hypothetical protein